MPIVPEVPVANRTPVPAETRTRVLARTYWTCFYCGYEARRDGSTGLWDLEVDHVTPRWVGGVNAEWNLVAACHPYNNLKGKALPPTELVAWAGELYGLDPDPDVMALPPDRVEPAPDWRTRTGRPLMRPIGSHLRFASAFRPRELGCPGCGGLLVTTGEVLVVGGEVGVVFVMTCVHCETGWEVDADE